MQGIKEIYVNSIIKCDYNNYKGKVNDYYPWFVNPISMKWDIDFLFSLSVNVLNKIYNKVKIGKRIYN